ncbi:hypothetical protein [Mesomycoplasma hyorhinis]|uniref:hypothetical protein n=1 Tax=Mesomycoplasma hyorhinis TaxID=2100 RepID=UPI001F4569ED|nr:hypothetical protein [Mesomycoplasma hyorhinis]
MVRAVSPLLTILIPVTTGLVTNNLCSSVILLAKNIFLSFGWFLASWAFETSSILTIL